jgi:hypothetical protein
VTARTCNRVGYHAAVGMTGAGSERGSGDDPGSIRLRASSEVVAQRLDDSIVLVHLGTNRIHELNRTGARFWELLEEEGDRARIEERLLEEFEVPESQLSEEVDGLVERFVAEDLVKIDDEG